LAVQGIQVVGLGSSEQRQPHLVVSPLSHAPLVERILGEIVALKAERDRSGHSPERMRDLTVWYDEAFGELQRARTIAKAAERRHGD